MSLSQLNLNDLVALDALLTERHITRAANRCNVTQSAMSHTLKRLRDVLGDPLLVKGSNALLPTDRALRLAEVVKRALGDIEQALFDNTAFDARTEKRMFTISCVDMVAVPMLVPLLARFREDAPGVGISIQPLRHDFVDRLERDQVDLAVVGPEDTQGMATQGLYTESLVCVVRANHPILTQEWNAEAFCSMRHITISPHDDDRVDLQAFVERLGLPMNVALRLPFFTLGPMMAAMSDLALVCPRRMALGMSIDFPLQLLPLPAAQVHELEVRVVWHPKRDGDAGLRWLRAEIEQAFDISSRAFEAGSRPPGAWWRRVPVDSTH
jgi:DNA-binding transcriptional LysR family regulator